MIELKPCPFCGKQPLHDTWQSEGSRTGRWHEYSCDNANCGDVEFILPTKKEAIAAWNNRVDGWLDIESAPADGTRVLLLSGNDIGIGSFHKFDRYQSGNVIGIHQNDQKYYKDEWEWDGEGFPVSPPPTHWRPLPEPPKERK